MNLNDLFTEEKVRLDPKCWTGKKIGNPKTKMKGGTRVNNCVPAESVNEMDKSQTPPSRDGSNDSDAGKKEYTAKATTPKKVAKHGEKILNKELNKKPGVAEGSEQPVSFREMVNVVDEHYPKYYAELSGSDISDKQFERAIVNAYKAIVKKQGVAEGANNHRALGRHHEEMADQELRKVGSKLPDSWDAVKLRNKLASHPKYAQALKHLDKSEYHFGKAAKQGVAEATGDQKFDTMMSRITAEPKYPDREMPPTSIPELIQWADQNNKPYHKFFAQWAQKHRFTNVNDALVWVGDNVDPWDEFGPTDHENDFGELVGEPLIDAAKHNPKAAELLKAFKCYEEIIDDWDDEYRQMNLPENQLDEKSVSQAQFRTMAAAAHNPKFARKVGISQDVAREFNKADKGQDYKKLPARTTEENERSRGRPTTGEWNPTSGKVGRTEKTPTGIRHHADPSRYGGTEPDPEFDTLNKNTINAMDRALGVKWDRESKKYFSPLKVDMDEGEQQKGADYRDPPEADYGDDYQDMVARVKKLAGLGPLKTVYDSQKRVYRNMPTAVQPKK